MMQRFNRLTHLRDVGLGFSTQEKGSMSVAGDRPFCVIVAVLLSIALLFPTAANSSPWFLASTNSSPWFLGGANSSPWFLASTNSSPWFLGGSTNSSPWFLASTNSSPWFLASTNSSPWFLASTNSSPWFLASTNSSPWFLASNPSTQQINLGTQQNNLGTKQNKPRVVILATGGTIAGSAQSSVQASYSPGIQNIETIIASVPEINSLAILEGIQVCNISSQNMEEQVWLDLWRIADSLFSNDLCDGIVITHGTDTMEETAYFLNLTLRHSQPVVVTGSMRPATAISADGPFNLYNAVALAASALAHNKGVMVTMNDYIYCANDVTKSNTVNTNAFSCPNFGPLGYMREGIPTFYRENKFIHTVASEFDISNIVAKRKTELNELPNAQSDKLPNTKFIKLTKAEVNKLTKAEVNKLHKAEVNKLHNAEVNRLPNTEVNRLPKTEIVLSYAFASDAAINAIIDSGVQGIVIAGVGHGNYNRPIAQAIKRAVAQNIAVVRSSRIPTGGVDFAAEEYDPQYPVSFNKSPQKARILLMLALTKTTNPIEIQRYFEQY